MGSITPMGALLRGLAAGAAGSAVQSGFFKLAAPITPTNPEGVFVPPEEQQKSESSPETVARRGFEQFAQGSALSKEAKARGGQIVHFGFGAGWGGLYGLARESLPALSGPLGVLAFSTAVWMISDNAILPAFKLAAPATAYPLKTHAFALGAHIAYGLGVWAAYEALRPQTWTTAAAALWALGKSRSIGKVLPRRARPATRSILTTVAKLYAQTPRARALVSELRA
jgi:hypothetical protein